MQTAWRSIGIQVGLTSTSSLPKRFRPRKKPGTGPEGGIRPVKSLGQHFLSDNNIVAKIADACDLTEDDVVIEVGPGQGVLTQHLSELAGLVIAVEVDTRLCQHLRQRFFDAPNVIIVEADILTTDPAMLLADAGAPPGTDYAVVGNLPYNIGSAVLRHFLEAMHPPLYIVAMLQREVATSIAAAPGKLGLLGVSVQVYAQVRRLFNVLPGAFYPPPKVVSSVIRLDLRAVPRVPLAERAHFFQVVKAGFSAPRKQLHNSITQGLQRDAAELTRAIEAAGINSALRPEDLSIDDWLRLSRQVEVGDGG